MSLLNKYQGLSEDYLQRSANQLNQANANAQNLGTYGTNFLARYNQDVVPMQNAARTAALFNPNLVDKAGVDAQLEVNNQMGAVQRNLSRMGVNPNSGRFQGLMQQAALEGAAQKAGAKTRAYAAEREGSFGRLMQAAGLGSEQAGLGLNALSTAASQAGNAAAGFRGLASDYGDIASDYGENANMGKPLAPPKQGLVNTPTPTPVPSYNWGSPSNPYLTNKFWSNRRAFSIL